MTDVLHGEVVGFRCWRVHGGRLLPLTQNPALRWEPGWNRAWCLRDPAHVAPVHECECGLYAYHEPGPTTLSPMAMSILGMSILGAPVVAGAVLARGELEVHPRGFRASEARVIALLQTSWVDDLPGLAARFGVPIVDDLELATADFSVVPKSMRPQSVASSDHTFTWVHISHSAISATSKTQYDNFAVNLRKLGGTLRQASITMLNAGAGQAWTTHESRYPPQECCAICGDPFDDKRPARERFEHHRRRLVHARGCHRGRGRLGLPR